MYSAVGTKTIVKLQYIMTWKDTSKTICLLNELIDRQGSKRFILVLSQQGR
jgi:hypothetical protein